MAGATNGGVAGTTKASNLRNLKGPVPFSSLPGQAGDGVGAGMGAEGGAPGSAAVEEEPMGPKEVRWHDHHGKDLTMVREFEPRYAPRPPPPQCQTLRAHSFAPPVPPSHNCKLRV